MHETNSLEMIEQKISFGDERILIKSIILPEDYPLYGKEIGFIQDILSRYLPEDFPTFSCGVFEGFGGMLLGRFLINISSKDVAKTMDDADQDMIIKRTRDHANTMWSVLHQKVKEIREQIRLTMKNKLAVAQSFEKIRESGVTNMLKRTEVQYYADKIGAYELVSAIQDAGKRGYMDLMSESFDLLQKLEEEDKLDAMLEEYDVREFRDLEIEEEW